MMTGGNIRECSPDEWPLLADNLYAMWRDIGAHSGQIKSDWQEEAAQFIAQGLAMYQLRGYVAVFNGAIVGSAAGQLSISQSPDIWEPDCRLRGYIWGVYVKPEHRGRGIAGSLTQVLMQYLQSQGCTEVRLHASPAGRPVYEKLGFLPASEMILQLPATCAHS